MHAGQGPAAAAALVASPRAQRDQRPCPTPTPHTHLKAASDLANCARSTRNASEPLAMRDSCCLSKSSRTMPATSRYTRAAAASGTESYAAAYRSVVDFAPGATDVSHSSRRLDAGIRMTSARVGAAAAAAAAAAPARPESSEPPPAAAAAAAAAASCCALRTYASSITALSGCVSRSHSMTPTSGVMGTT